MILPPPPSSTQSTHHSTHNSSTNKKDTSLDDTTIIDGAVRFKSNGDKNKKSLLAHLESAGVMQRVQDLEQYYPHPQIIDNSHIQQIPHERNNDTETTATPSNNAAMHSNASSKESLFTKVFQQNEHTNERKIIVHQIIFPLLTHLNECYSILDNLPQEKNPPPSSSVEHASPPTDNNSSTTLNNNNSNSNNAKKKKKRRNPAAPPPLGMLSLNDYTNVACLLEFAISASLVPCLEYPFVYFSQPPVLASVSGSKATTTTTTTTTSAEFPAAKPQTIPKTTFLSQKRNQSLPKSLAGRISKSTLTWGTLFFATQYNEYCVQMAAAASDVKSDLKTPSSQKHPSNGNDINGNSQTTTMLHSQQSHPSLPPLVLQQHAIKTHQIIQTYQIYNELTLLATTIGQVLLLDRFRPMLLPRHLNDVYLTLLFLERLRWWLSKNNAPKNVNEGMMCDGDKSGDASMREGIGNYCEKDTRFMISCIEKAKEKEEYLRQRLHSLEKALLFSSMVVLPSPFFTAHQSSMPTALQLPLIDHREAALAYRTLLSGGAIMGSEISLALTSSVPSTSSQSVTSLTMPPWLRMRLGQCLTKLAYTDLHSVVDVFVAFARGPGSGADAPAVDDEMTASAARLARALCAQPSLSQNASSSSLNRGPNTFVGRLCYQFVEFLVFEGETNGKKPNNEEEKIEASPRSRSSVAMLLTLWAAIGQLPLEVLRSSFIRMLTSGLIPKADVSDNELQQQNKLTALQSVVAIGMWLSSAPSSIDPSTKKKVDSLLLAPCMRQKEMTVLGQTLRLVAALDRNVSESMQSKLVVEINSCNEEKNKCKEFKMEAELTLVQIAKFLMRSSDRNGKGVEEQCNIVSLELVKAVTSNALDKDGYSFQCASTSLSWSREYSRKLVEKKTADTAFLLEDIERRAGIVASTICTPFSKMADKKQLGSTSTGVDQSTSREYLLPGTMFQLVLLIHFSSLGTNSDGSGIVTSQIKSALEDHGLANVFTLNKEGVKMTVAVLLALLCENCSPASLLAESVDNSDDSESGVLKMLALVTNCAAAHLGVDEKSFDIESLAEDSQELFSTASVVLSLLTTLLELGAKKRSNLDEALLQSILPALGTLSSSNGRDVSPSSARGDLESAHLSVAIAELAEMASHAMALIASRKESVSINDPREPFPTGKKSQIEMIHEKLSQAEHDLQSSQPPLRAKGVVSLRHIARSLVNEKENDNIEESISTSSSFVKSDGGKLITEIHQSTGTLTESTSKEELALIARTLTRICLDALADSESYVYLASIQTLVAVSDVCPSIIMPLMGNVVANGKMPGEEMKPTELSYSLEQRIKATEALIFMIRRRGEGVFVCGPSLLDTVLFGSRQNQDDNASKNVSDIVPYLIQSQTHSYFSGQEIEDPEDVNVTEEVKIRLNTGGPVFEKEEADVLRAASISVVGELISVLDPIVVASYCHILVRLATAALQLDSSRPIRRAAANLSRELYACIEKETTVMSGEKVETTSNMAVAMMSAGEGTLYNALQLCASADDVDVKGKVRVVDPATQARCAEALQIRSELESLAIMSAAKLIAESLENESNDPVVQAVRRALSQNSLQE